MSLDVIIETEDNRLIVSVDDLGGTGQASPIHPPNEAASSSLQDHLEDLCDHLLDVEHGGAKHDLRCRPGSGADQRSAALLASLLPRCHPQVVGEVCDAVEHEVNYAVVDPPLPVPVVVRHAHRPACVGADSHLLYLAQQRSDLRVLADQVADNLRPVVLQARKDLLQVQPLSLLPEQGLARGDELASLDLGDDVGDGGGVLVDGAGEGDEDGDLLVGLVDEVVDPQRDPVQRRETEAHPRFQALGVVGAELAQAWVEA
mmetsp:Transcript_30795/g.69434  ORF Transcript_30795/g.69434 Transcript_30795/m.69434 type:complete len:259 (-) Transcript_30795:2555-3331(-)